VGAFMGVGGEVHAVLRQPGIGESAPGVPSGVIPQASQEREPIRGVQGDGECDRRVGIEEVRQFIHRL
jgi:hypothetical protein